MYLCNVIVILYLVFPVIIENPASISFNYFVNGNLQAAFWCKAYGIPEPTINWKKVNQLINNKYYLKIIFCMF